VLNARQTASPVTACLRTNVYLVMPATRAGACYENHVRRAAP
jgi:hypothetical protein